MRDKFFISHLIIRFFIWCIGIFIVSSCANIVPPNGGAKDTTPPKIIKTEPENYATHFHGHVIKVVFDEYIKLNNLMQQLMISPPSNMLPDVSVRGKTLIIKIKDTLVENTTYNFYFGSAIADITEGNTYNNFSYVFSTGSFVDSLSLTGQVIYGKDLKPAEEVLVMLYDTYYDSIPYLNRPLYITKTDKQGRFQLNNLKQTNYKIFALADANSNMLFDQPSEKIAFLDTLLKPEYIAKALKPIKDTIPVSDTLLTDSIKADSLLNDSLKKINTTTSFTLFMFEEADTLQKVVKKNLEKKGLVTVAFKHPVHYFKIEYPSIPNHKEILFEEFNTDSNILKIWIKEEFADSLFALLYHNNILLDTLNLSIIPRSSKREATPKLMIIPNIKNNTSFDYFAQPSFELSNPIVFFNADSILFLEDSLPITPELHFTDTLKRYLTLRNKLKEGSNYEIYFPPNTFTCIFKNEQDSLHLKFKTKTKEDYGKLIFNITLPNEDHPYIFYLLDEKSNIVKEQNVLNTQKIECEHIQPGKYSVKVVFDQNNDGKWTTGHYMSKRQPEKVYVSKGEIMARANWDVEVEIKVEEKK